MTLPPPPYRIAAIDGQPEQDQHGNWSAFVTLDNGESALLRMKGPFPIVGDEITDRVLEETVSRSGNTYLKLVKPKAQNGSSAPRAAQKSDGPGEAYWAGQNAAKGRSAAQDRAIAAYAAGFRHPRSEDPPREQRDIQFLVPLIDWFYEDVQQAAERARVAAEGAPAPVAAADAAASLPTSPGADSSPGGNGQAPPQRGHNEPTEAQVKLMVKMARERGIDGPGMKLLLQQHFGAQQFSQLHKNDCVDRWKAVVGGPVPDPAAAPDVPADPWPADGPEPVHAGTPGDDDIPFRTLPTPNREHVRRDLFVGDRWLA